MITISYMFVLGNKSIIKDLLYYQSMQLNEEKL